MKKGRIVVGSEYKEAFNSVVGLINGGCFKGLPYSVSGGVISDGTNEYVLSDESTESQSKEKFVFLKDGATWFKNLRERKFDDTNAVWTSFIENIDIEYHKRFSVVEYENKITSQFQEEKVRQNANDICENFINLFYKDYSSNVVVNKKAGKSEEDIYGVSMRIELSGGSGASLPVLCKMFFSKDGRKMYPVVSTAAKRIEESLEKIIPSGEDKDVENTSIPSGLIDTVLNALNDVINDKKNNFGSYIYFDNENDLNAVNGLIDKMSHDAFEIECQRVDVLYLSHIKSETNKFDVYSSGMPMFICEIGLNNSFSIYCANCGDGNPIVERNEITVIENGFATTYTLNPLEENFGLTDEEIEKIINYGSIKDHFISIDCNDNPSNSLCGLKKCRSQLVEIHVGEDVIYKCKDCIYPEVMLVNDEGEKQYVPNLVFVRDKLKMVNKDSAGISKCSVCGRYFSSSYMRHGKCPLCDSLNDCSFTPESIALYKKYKNILSISTRFFNIFSKKGCVEDAEFILFKLGNKEYVFNKLNAKETGYVEGPKKLNRGV